MLADKPQFFFVAGPSGGGKSRWFKDSRLDSFNIDDHAATLNGGSYVGISTAARDRAFQELQFFAETHFQQKRSFATETTLRSLWVLPMAKRASEEGFDVRCTFIAAGPWTTHVERVTKRAELRGHSAPESVIRSIYLQSLSNLPLLFEAAAFGTIHTLTIADNAENRPRLVLDIRHGFVEYLAAYIPSWLVTALQSTVFSIPVLRRAAEERIRLRHSLI
jgi:predicted ABC-type ATPase